MGEEPYRKKKDGQPEIDSPYLVYLHEEVERMGGTKKGIARARAGTKKESMAIRPVFIAGARRQLRQGGGGGGFDSHLVG